MPPYTVAPSRRAIAGASTAWSKCVALAASAQQPRVDEVRVGESGLALSDCPRCCGSRRDRSDRGALVGSTRNQPQPPDVEARRRPQPSDLTPKVLNGGSVVDAVCLAGPCVPDHVGEVFHGRVMAALGRSVSGVRKYFAIVRRSGTGARAECRCPLTRPQRYDARIGCVGIVVQRLWNRKPVRSSVAHSVGEVCHAHEPTESVSPYEVFQDQTPCSPSRPCRLCSSAVAPDDADDDATDSSTTAAADPSTTTAAVGDEYRERRVDPDPLSMDKPHRRSTRQI